MIIIFMISSSTALSAIVCTGLALSNIVDSQHRIRADRIDSRPHAVWRGRDWLVKKVKVLLGKALERMRSEWTGKEVQEKDQEMETLLGNS